MQGLGRICFACRFYVQLDIQIKIYTNIRKYVFPTAPVAEWGDCLPPAPEVPRSIPRGDHLGNAGENLLPGFFLFQHVFMIRKPVLAIGLKHIFRRNFWSMW